MTHEPELVVEVTNHVATVRFNRPKKYNAWREKDTDAMRDAFLAAAADEAIHAVILTGTGKYYCAGADFKDGIALMWPAALRAAKTKYNRELFEAFLNFPKPLVVAVNGPAIGAAVTSSALADFTLCGPAATFRTPFAELGLPAEGCSSVNFPRKLGARNSERMLADGETMNAANALEIGLVDEVCESTELLQQRAQAVAEELARNGGGRSLFAQTPGLREQLLEVNAQESVDLGNAVLSKPFFQANQRIAEKQGNKDALWAFWLLEKASPIISRL
jgi:enoyl-CoA hydratase/carnithine racemase